MKPHETRSAEGGAAAQPAPSALHDYFHVQLRGSPAKKPPLPPGSPGKGGSLLQPRSSVTRPSDASGSALGTRSSVEGPSLGARQASPSIPSRCSSPSPGAAKDEAQHQQHGHSSSGGNALTTRPSAGGGSPGTSKSAPSGSKQSKSVAAALNAVLHKQDKGIKGLSSAPDESLQKDKVNKDVLKKMRDTFENADHDGTGELTPEEFVASFVGILQTEDGGDEAALRKLFMRIDANGDGTIDWDEFSTFMLLESQGSANLRDLENSISFEPAEEWAPNEGVAHDKIITHISHATLPNGADRYITCSKDGMVKIWNAKDLTLMRTLPVGRSSWVTCAKMLPATRKLAVTAFSRCMKIYDLQTYELCGQIQELEYAPMCADVWAPARKKDVEMVVFGDGGGFVRLHELRVNPLEEKTSNDRYLDTVKWKHQQHTDWVTCIKYVEELNSIIAGSLDKAISLTDAEDRVGVKVLEGHLKGVSALDWSPAYKFIVSGSQDRRLMLWNPFSLKPLATLTGHLSSVTAVMVNDRDNQIVSVSADKQVKLWDIRNHKCIQSLTDREVVDSGDEDTLLAGLYDARRKLLVTGNTYPKVWRQTITAAASCGHRSPVTRVLYNEQFSEAVSADQAGTVSVWYVPTGKLRFRFDNTHPGTQLTALSFDAAKRRLLTGSDTGEVKVWNFSSGACLCTLRPRAHSKSPLEEVTCMLTIRSALFKHFVVGGWDRRITLYEDPGPQQKETFPGRIIHGHQADILDMAVMEGTNILVSCADDGEVCTWNVESGALRRRTMPRGQDLLPMNQQAIERVAFLRGKLRHIFVTVGADRWLRFWDCATNTIILELFTGHVLGETVQGLALHPDNQYIATGDGAGFVKVWDIREFTGAAVASHSAARDLLPQLAVFRAHKQGITSMDWVTAGKEGEFVLTSSMDKTVSLWSMKGAFVGQFGAHVWLLDMQQSWRAAEPFPLDPRDALDLETSCAPPKRPRPGHGDNSSDGELSTCSSAVLSPRPLTAQSTGTDRPQPATVPPLGGGAGVGALAGGQSKARLGSARSLRGPPSLRIAEPAQAGAPDRAVASPSRCPSRSPSRLARVPVGVTEATSAALPSPHRASMAGYGEAKGEGGKIPGERNARRSFAAMHADQLGPGSLTGSGRLGGGEGGGGRALAGHSNRVSIAGTVAGGSEDSRPGTAARDVAKVLAASRKDRLKRLNSSRKHDKPEDFLPGGRYSRPGNDSHKSLLSIKADILQLPPAMVQVGPVGGGAGHPAAHDAGEDSDGPSQHAGEAQECASTDSSDLAAESESSSGHSSDADIPRALWLQEFDLARRAAGPRGGEASPAHRATSPGGRKGRDRQYNPASAVSRKVQDGAVALAGADSTRGSSPVRRHK